MGEGDSAICISTWWKSKFMIITLYIPLNECQPHATSVITIRVGIVFKFVMNSGAIWKGW